MMSLKSSRGGGRLECFSLPPSPLLLFTVGQGKQGGRLVAERYLELGGGGGVKVLPAGRDVSVVRLAGGCDGAMSR